MSCSQQESVRYGRSHAAGRRHETRCWMEFGSQMTGRGFESSTNARLTVSWHNVGRLGDKSTSLPPRQPKHRRGQLVGVAMVSRRAEHPLVS